MYRSNGIAPMTHLSSLHPETTCVQRAASLQIIRTPPLQICSALNRSEYNCTGQGCVTFWRIYNIPLATAWNLNICNGCNLGRDTVPTPSSSGATPLFQHRTYLCSPSRSGICTAVHLVYTAQHLITGSGVRFEYLLAVDRDLLDVWDGVPGSWGGVCHETCLARNISTMRLDTCA